MANLVAAKTRRKDYVQQSKPLESNSSTRTAAVPVYVFKSQGRKNPANSSVRRMTGGTNRRSSRGFGDCLLARLSHCDGSVRSEVRATARPKVAAVSDSESRQHPAQVQARLLSLDAAGAAGAPRRRSHPVWQMRMPGRPRQHGAGDAEVIVLSRRADIDPAALAHFGLEIGQPLIGKEYVAVSQRPVKRTSPCRNSRVQRLQEGTCTSRCRSAESRTPIAESVQTRTLSRCTTGKEYVAVSQRPVKSTSPCRSDTVKGTSPCRNSIACIQRPHAAREGKRTSRCRSAEG
jgi:hypothetical protein